ncbi:hypothetical protein [Pseudomonas sp. CGJS7]|uniref:hypothetical protein n=1 Tax=Pseudomonas sp. CGJS7 TaxID=3109348 RepID=UPI00300B67CB
MTTLRYNGGQDVRIGDSIRFGDTEVGTIVVMIAEQTDMPGHQAADWAYLKDGCMIDVPAFGLFHYDAEGFISDANLILLSRA